MASLKSPTTEIPLQIEQGEDLDRTLVKQENPLNWSAFRKWAYTTTVVWMAGIVGFSSSVHTSAIAAIAAEFNTSRQISTLGATTYLVGFGFGPFFAPLSELCRLLRVTERVQLRGFHHRPVATAPPLCPPCTFTVASFCGPVLAPIIGGFLTQYASWRWGFWLVVIISGIVYAVIVLALPETYAPRLVELKTAKTRPDAQVLHEPLKDRFVQNLVRPWIMLFTEPILFFLSLYMAFLYGVLFLDFSAYPVVFQQARGWSVSISGLSFLGIGIGMALAAALSPQVNHLHSHFVRKLGPLPEARLPHLIGIAWLLPVGLFWFGWTALPPTHWVVSMIGGVPFGFGLVMVFLGINSYLTDCYDRFSASALAANTMLRSLFGA
ncbi:hypothetical protein DL770_008036 [Monosporascus sp. CRB-9-2]|nr:hypothetical protein DL770_008036 [Monosporascus sp. CRB-9-2]